MRGSAPHPLAAVGHMIDLSTWERDALLGPTSGKLGRMGRNAAFGLFAVVSHNPLSLERRPGVLSKLPISRSRDIPLGQYRALLSRFNESDDVRSPNFGPWRIIEVRCSWFQWRS